MKSEKVARAITAAYKEGHEDGQRAAYERGYEDGKDKGFLSGYEAGFNDGKKCGTPPPTTEPPEPGKRVLHLGNDDGSLVCKTTGSVPYTHDESEATCKECVRASKDRQEGYVYDRT